MRKKAQGADENTRLQFVEMLAKLGTEDALYTLALMLPETSQRVQQAVAHILTRPDRRAAQALYRLLGSRDVRQQGAALEIIAADGDIRHAKALAGYVHAVLSNALPTPDDLGERAVSILEAMGTDEALIAVNRWREQHSSNTLAVAPAPPPKAVVMRAGRADIVNYQQALHALIKHIRAGRWGDQQDAARALHGLMRGLPDEHVPEVVAMFAQALNDENPVVRWTIVEALAWLSRVEAVPVLRQCLCDPNWSVRVAAILALVEIGDVATVRWIEPMLDDPNTNVQEAAVEAVGRLGSPRYAPLLAHLINSDRDPMVRIAAVNAARRLRAAGALPALVAALSSPHLQLRWTAARSLAELANETVENDLIARLYDEGRPQLEEKRVCDWLIEALERMDTPAARTAVRQWKQTRV
ncbi:MAG: HEAT repeat domain-containing protein [Chloroflexi bacterium]|nr:HEAT repeat domain-containing protein [Chloroflexota bacterium]